MNKSGKYFVSYVLTFFHKKETPIHLDRIVEFEEPLSFLTIEKLRKKLIYEHTEENKRECVVTFQNFILL